MDLPVPGLLHLDLAVAGWLPSGAHLAVFGGDGAAAGRETLDRSAAERLVLAPAGTYWLEITGEDPDSPLPVYRLGTRFVALTKSETDGEIEIEPEELRTGCGGVPPLVDLLCRDAGGDDHGDTFRLLRTLGPGTYFVRVEGVGSTGAYDLSVRELGR